MFIHIYIYVQTHTHIYIYTHIYTHSYIYIYIYIYIHGFIYIHAPTPTHTHTHTHIYIYIYIYIYIMYLYTRGDFIKIYLFPDSFLHNPISDGIRHSSLQVQTNNKWCSRKNNPFAVCPNFFWCSKQSAQAEWTQRFCDRQNDSVSHSRKKRLLPFSAIVRAWLETFVTFLKSQFVFGPHKFTLLEIHFLLCHWHISVACSIGPNGWKTIRGWRV